MSHRIASHARALRIGVALAALNTAALVHAQTFRLYVDASAPVGGDGRSWSHAMRDLQDAIQASFMRPIPNQPVEIRIAQGIYTPDRGTFDRGYAFAIFSGVSLLGGFVGLLAGPGGDPDQRDPARFVSTLSGDLLRNDGPSDSTRADNSFLLLNDYSTTGVVDGLTLRGAAQAIEATAGGGLISRCTITDNVATPATVFNPNSAYPIVELVGVTFRDCSITNNRSATVAIVATFQCRLQLCTIAGNRLAQDGWFIPLAPAAIDLGSNSSLDACVIAANTSETLNLSTAAGIPLYNCTIVDNRALSAPGVSGPALQLYNCIFSRNIATNGTTQQVYGYGPFLFTCFLDHGLNDVQAAPGSSVIGTQTISGSPGFVNASGADGDPMTWADNDYRLAAGSPCVDHANSLYIPNTSAHTDILGRAPFDDPGAPNIGTGPSTIIDVGAFERAPTPCIADFDRNGVLSPTDLMVFISAWLSGDMRADVDNSGTLTSHDVLEFIGVWFAGCPS